ncbi:aldo/keto reductase [Pendulispora brunnea]|uniref:Aldo/keto reductase n=1 Tax=Pendulispora brunnea TaxID=2905690 RepID=A0ABZ2KAR4_9BACT
MSGSFEGRRTRRMRVARCDPADRADRFELRDAFVADDDAEVRAAALQRLDAAAARHLLPYVRDAAQDSSMRVREAAFVALARAEDTDSLHRAAYACRYDRGFRVRRMALLFAARTFGLDALPVLALASRDPFWRVRVAARRAAAMLDATIDTHDPCAPLPPVAIPGADDPDPAVVTARLRQQSGRVAPCDLLGALAHAHQALRRIAVTEISARGDEKTLYAVTRHLVDERIPYAPAAAEATLARSRVRGAAVAAQILECWDAEPAGPLAWALGTATMAPNWSILTELIAHEDVRVRRAAVLRVPEAAPSRSALLDAMASLLSDRDEWTRNRTAAWLARSASHEAKAILLRLEPTAQSTFVRSVLVELHAGARNIDIVRAFSNDQHGAIRAAAVSARVALGDLTSAERRTLELDPDPWMRRVVFTSESAAADPDAELRAQAARGLVAETTDRATVTLLRLARDVDHGVRSIATEALAERTESVRRLLDAGALQSSERIAAYTLLSLGHGMNAKIAETDTEALAHLALLDDVVRERPPCVASPARVERVQAPSAHTRTLGRTGIRVHPFGLSGAHGLDFVDFSRAYERGVNLYFWEPSHRELARFLRNRADAVVVAGTYHADADAIERDVVRALRTLKRDSLDVFLAFWTRSAARIEATGDVLRQLVKRGLVRAFGVSTHDRDLACRAAKEGFDVVMVRHSAAHRGAEANVFPHCASHGTGVLTFSNLCYGRMLHRSPVALSSPVTAPDCYRYSLAQPGVHACIAAPRRHSELMENLAVVDSPDLPENRRIELRAHGDHVYERSKAWSAETWAVAERPRPDARWEQRDSLSEWLDFSDSTSRDVC